MKPEHREIYEKYFIYYLKTYKSYLISKKYIQCKFSQSVKRNINTSNIHIQYNVNEEARPNVEEPLNENPVNNRVKYRLIMHRED